MSESARPSRAASRLRQLLTGIVIALLAALAAAAPAPAAVDVRHTYAGPIETGSPCTAEPRHPMYRNTAFDPANPVSGTNTPAREDVRPNPVAGAKTDFCVAYALTPSLSDPTRLAESGETADPAADPATGDDHRRIQLDTPEGFAGYAGSAAICSDEDFGIGSLDEPECAPASQVGDGIIRAHLLGLMLTLGDHNVAIFNLAASANEAARLGVAASSIPGAIAPSKFIVRIVFTGGEHNRLRSIVEDAPRTVNAGGTEFPIYVESVGLRFWGPEGVDRPAFGPGQAPPPRVTTVAPFAENGTQCGADLRADVAITTYADHRSAASSAPYRLAGCDALGFSPHVTVTTDERAAGVPTGAAVHLRLDQSAGSARSTALLRAARVRLPDGLELGAQAGSRDGGLATCTAAGFAELQQAAPDCPAASRVGSVRIVSPLLQEPLVGEVFLGEQPAVGRLPDLYVHAAFAGATAGDAPRIKLVGRTEADEAGRLTSIFERNPQLRFSELELRFDGGPSALFTTPRYCATASGAAAAEPWSGGPAATSEPQLVIDEACDPVGFAAQAGIAPADARAGEHARTDIVLVRPDRSAWMSAATVALPPGLLANLRGVPECTRAQAAQAACPQESRIGTVTTLAGAGERPVTVAGAMYLTERTGTEVAGATIIARARIGDVDLGDVVVPGSIALRPTDAGLTYSAAIPQRQHGVALGIRQVHVALDRPGFALNPSSCGPLGWTADLHAANGEVSRPAGAVSYHGCAARPFAPRVATELSGQVRERGHPNVHVTITPRPGDSNMRATKLTLPGGISTDLRNLQVRCSQADFSRWACPVQTRVGWVAADVPIAPERVEGYVYLVDVPGEVLPGLGLAFHGRFAQLVQSTVRIERSGRITTDFAQVPDLPMSRLEVRILGGDRGPIQLSDEWCSPKAQWSTLLSSHGGTRTRVRSDLACASDARIRLSDAAGFSLRLFDTDERRLQSVKVTLPRSHRFVRSRATRRAHGWARMKGSRRVRLRATGRTFSVRARTRQAENVRVKLDGSAIRRVDGRRGSRRVTVEVRLAFTNGAVERQQVRVRAR